MANVTMVVVVVMMTVMRFLLGFFFVGWLLVWIVTPTTMYREQLQSKITTGFRISCLGKQGSNILFYALPILFISVIGCLYLYAERKFGKSHQYDSFSVRRTRMKSIWKKPVLVKGPMGIVSVVELTSFSMFLLLLVWYFAKCLHLCFSELSNVSLKKNGEHTWETGVKNVGLCLALVGNICVAFLFFPITRGSSILPIIGLKSESSVKYHIWVGHIALAIYLVHGLCYIVTWTVTAQFHKMLSWKHSGVSNMAGEIALFFGLIMWLTSSNRIRRKSFEVFFYTHQLYIVFMVFFLLHVGVSIFGIVLPGFYLFLLDRYLRFLQSRQEVQLVSVRLSPVGGIFELNFSKWHGVDYTPTSIVFINIPRISRLQWHPFTVVSNSNLEIEKLSVIIKKEGWWTQKLHDLLLSSSSSSSSSSSIDHLEAFVEGPYGHNTTDFLRYETLVLVSGGSGITSFISIIRELIYQSRTSNQRIPNIHLISIFKSSTDLNFFNLLLPLLTLNYSGNNSDVDGESSSDISSLPLKIEAFVTRERDVTINSYRKHLQTIRFKQVIPDRQEPPLLGENGGWLSLSLIILSSSFGFLLLSFLTNRFFVDPIENLTDNMFFSYSSEAILNFLFVMVPIMLTTTIVVAWNRKRSVKSTHTYHQNPISSPLPLMTLSRMNGEIPEEFHDEDFFDDHLMEVIKVHFGKRPDLKQMLLACDLPNTSVFVSGPSGLCHEVATICSSRSARNLEFECMSYNW